MKFTSSLIILVSVFFIAQTFASGGKLKSDNMYDFTVQNIRGQHVSLKDFEGKTLLIVNTASMCGYTKQYEDLQNLYEKYADRGLVILGFPSGDFGGQEYGTDEEIAEFCEVNFNIKFPLFSRVSVRGDDKHALFDYLTTQDNKDFTGDIRWNFEKFLISPSGKLERRFRSDVNPTSEELTSAVEELLP